MRKVDTSHSCPRYSKLLAHSLKTTYNSTTYRAISLNAVSVEPGDLIEVGLENFNFSLLETKKQKLFVKINNKIKKYKIKTNITESNGTIDNSKFLQVTYKDLKETGYFFQTKLKIFPKSYIFVAKGFYIYIIYL